MIYDRNFHKIDVLPATAMMMTVALLWCWHSGDTVFEEVHIIAQIVLLIVLAPA